MAGRGDRAPTLDPGRLSIPPGHAWSRLPWIGAALGLIGIGASAWLGSADPARFYFSWLVAFLFFLGIALGGLFFVLAHFVTKAAWSVVLRRLAEGVMATLPVFALLFVPVAFGMHELFHWSHADALEHDPVLRGKAGYLNPGFFLVRAAFYLVSWAVLAIVFTRASRRQDLTGDERITKRLIQASAPALFLFAITVTFAAVDWAMSLDPHWYSTIYGVYFFSGSVVSVLAFLILLAGALRRAGLVGDALTAEHFHDLGKLLFGFTVFWAYIAFSQFFLIWYGNIPEETAWYLRRYEGSWMSVSALLAWGHFLVPFFFLMSRWTKRRTGLLALGAGWLLLMHLADIYWLVMPVHQAAGARPALLDLTTLVGVGGLFLAALGWQLRRGSLVPLRDPRLAESLSFENP